MSNTLDVVGFAGSLRSGSYNRALLGTLIDIAPGDLNIESFELDEVPLYNGDIEKEGDPESVIALKNNIEEAEGLLIVTPEYNHGVPAVTKNAVDWASRTQHRDSSVISDKPTALAGATPGSFGTVRSQLQLRQSLDAVGAQTMRKPEVLVGNAGDKFDDGELVDDETKDFLGVFLNAFKAWIRRLD